VENSTFLAVFALLSTLFIRWGCGKLVENLWKTPVLVLPTKHLTGVF
jgi:hypothetical protein